MKGILVILACAVAGYVIVMLLMNTKADDLRPPGDRDDPPPPGPAPEARKLPAPTERPTSSSPRSSSWSSSSPPSSSSSSRPQGGDWSLLLDVPRSASERDIEAAFRRQSSKAEAVGDRDMVERLKQARAAALAEKKRG
jgi:hypothetical protein